MYGNKSTRSLARLAWDWALTTGLATRRCTGTCGREPHGTDTITAMKTGIGTWQRDQNGTGIKTGVGAGNDAGNDAGNGTGKHGAGNGRYWQWKWQRQPMEKQNQRSVRRRWHQMHTLPRKSRTSARRPASPLLNCGRRSVMLQNVGAQNHL